MPMYIQESAVTQDNTFRRLSAEPADPMSLGPNVVDGKLQDFFRILRQPDLN